MSCFEYIWRNKWLTAQAQTIDDMIDGLQAAADELRAMKAEGVCLRDTQCVSDDFAFLVTTDPKVAEKFGFEEEDLEDEDESGEEEPFEQEEENR